ncbi:MAG: hypothetical protein R3C26_20615 [Calditrichia bacterium]
MLKICSLLAEYDRIDGRFYDNGLDEALMAEPITEIVPNLQTGLNDTITYRYELKSTIC